MADSKCLCKALPPQCLAGAAIGAGTVAAVALSRDEKLTVHQKCAMSSLAGLGAAAAVAAVHHAKHARRLPPWYCVAPVLGTAVGVALAWRSQCPRCPALAARAGAKPGLPCWVGAAVGVAAVVAGALLLGRK
eukprot:EG_transcript_30993